MRPHTLTPLRFGRRGFRNLRSKDIIPHDPYPYPFSPSLLSAPQSDKDSREEILRAFKLFDDDETGKISFKNLKRVARELGENITDDELQEMIDEADRDGDGEINQEEFLRIMKKTALF